MSRFGEMFLYLSTLVGASLLAHCKYGMSHCSMNGHYLAHYIHISGPSKLKLFYSMSIFGPTILATLYSVQQYLSPC